MVIFGLADSPDLAVSQQNPKTTTQKNSNLKTKPQKTKNQKPKPLQKPKKLNPPKTYQKPKKPTKKPSHKLPTFYTNQNQIFPKNQNK
jgi:cell division protein FtsN